MPGIAVIASASIVALLLAASFAFFGTYSRKTRVQGILVPINGLFQVTTPQAGTVKQLLVKEGDYVTEGQLLGAINIDHSTSHGQTAALILTSVLQRKLSLETEQRLIESQMGQRQRAYSEKIRSMLTEEDSITSDLNGIRLRVELSTRNVERYDALAKNGYVPEIQAQQRKEELIDLQSKQIGVERGLTILRRDKLR